MNGDTEPPPASGDSIGPEARTASEAPVWARLFDRTDWLSFWVTTGAALAVYLFTLSSEVGLGNAGIFATGAMYAGVPHPPGYPVWTIYAWLFTRLLPFSNIAWRVAVSSAVAGAGACGMVALMVSRGGVMMVEGMARFRRLEPAAERWLRVVSGYVAGMAFGLSGTFWKLGMMGEDSGRLGLLLFAIVLALLMRWGHAPKRRRYLYCAWLVYGLALGSDLSLLAAAPGLLWLILFLDSATGRDFFAATMVLVGIAFNAMTRGILPRNGFTPVFAGIGLLALLIWMAMALKTKRMFSETRAVLGSGVFLALGLSFYLFLPIASMANPPMNWGYAREWQGFLHLVGRGQYEQPNPTASFSRYAGQLGEYGEITVSEFGLIYIVPAVIPFFFLHRMRWRERNWMLGLAGVYLCLSAFMVAMLNPSREQSEWNLIKEYFAASHLVLALWAGYGLVLLGTILATPGKGGWRHRQRAPKIRWRAAK